MTEGGVDGVTILDLTSRPPRLLDDSLGGARRRRGRHHARHHDGRHDPGRPGRRLQRRHGPRCWPGELAPLRLSAASYADQPAVTAELGLADLLDLGDPYEFDLAAPGAAGPTATGCGCRSASAPDGRPIELDLKESAQDGMGPHGLLVGATGSGKSELLRTLVLALAVTHSSEILNFVLVDFKGGATFAALDRLPHTSAVITNLGRRAVRWSTGCSTRSTASWSAGRSCCARPATTPRSATTSGPARPARRWRRCPAC